MTRSAYVLACVLACLSGGHAVPFDCETMTHLGLPTGCLLGLKTASYGTLAVCKDVLCRKLLTDTGGNAEWIINPNGGCTLSPRGTQAVQDLICVSNSAIQPSAPTPVPDTTAPTSVPTAVPATSHLVTPYPNNTPFDCETMAHLGLPTGCLLGQREASYGTLAACKDVLCRKLLTDTGGNAEWIINPNGGCILVPRGKGQPVQDLICVPPNVVQPSAPTPAPDTTAPTAVPTAVPT
eukprot:Rhum_TRINITY_DN15233_c5_g2::Rhum_TRINITY_DN15233_c5_g2_i2::g.145944::m.145944